MMTRFSHDCIDADNYATGAPCAACRVEFLERQIKNALDAVFNDGRQPSGWVQIQTGAIESLRRALLDSN